MYKRLVDEIAAGQNQSSFIFNSTYQATLEKKLDIQC